jgi:hypothetical protein
VSRIRAAFLAAGVGLAVVLGALLAARRGPVPAEEAEGDSAGATVSAAPSKPLPADIEGRAEDPARDGPAREPVPRPRPVPFPRGDPERLESLRRPAETELASARRSVLDSARAGIAAGTRAVAEGRPVILTGGLPRREFAGVDPATGLWFAHLGCGLGRDSLAYARAHNAAVVVALLGGDPSTAGD